MINGTFEEHFVANPWHNMTTPSSNNPEWIMNHDDNVADIFSISGTTAVNLQRFCFNFLTGNSTNIAEGLDFGGKDQHQIQYSALLDGSLDDRIRNYTTVLSRVIRIGTPIDTLYNTSVIPPTHTTCQSLKQVERIHISWWWLIPPLFVISYTTAIFVVMVILTQKTDIGIRKGNILDLLSWAPSDESRTRMHEDTESWDLRRTRDATFESSQDEQDRGLRLRYVGGGRKSDLRQGIRKSAHNMLAGK